MSMHEDDLALARMDDDGHGCAITAPPRPVITSHRNGSESQQMKSAELGRYVCVLECQHSPHITIRTNGVWVKQGPGGPFSSAHRDCYQAWANAS